MDIGLLHENHHQHQFVDANNLSSFLVKEYNLLLVFLSVLVMCIAAYSALRIVERIWATPAPVAKNAWIVAGAVTLGIGVWAMHFIGMLALVLPYPVTYDISITLASMIPSVFASMVMLIVISRRQLAMRHLLVGGTLMGSGIGAMHYVGMAAMQSDMMMVYDKNLFIVSLFVAVFLAIIALYTKTFMSRYTRLHRVWVQFTSALIMGFASVGMHYIGMAAADFLPGDGSSVITSALEPLWLGIWVGLASLMITGTAIVITFVDQRLALSNQYSLSLKKQVAERTQELSIANRQLQDELEQRRQIQDALSLAKEAAEAASKAKADFLANMSHEIRTPLNAIVGMTQLLHDTPLVNEQRDFVETIRTSSDILLSVINDILDFSKIEAHKLELETRPFNLRQCIEEALDLVATKAAEKKIEIAYLADSDLPSTIVGDITRLRQILLNLLNNAIKFTDLGEVVISVEGMPLPDKQPQTIFHDDRPVSWFELHFCIRDTGIGITPAAMDRLFQSFSQADTSTTRKYGGTGLGLTISKYLSEIMGGHMWVESEGVAGQGSSFHFTIQTEVVFGQVASEKDGNAAQLQGKRGLIVDDNEINRLILTRQLESWGIDSVAVASGTAALVCLQNDEQFDFAILDLCMPEMNGFVLAGHLRQHPKGAALPLVMLSSIGDKATHLEAKALNFAAVMAKPVKEAQLKKIMAEIFAQEVQPLKAPLFSGFDSALAERLPLRILLVEDNLVNQKVAQYMLSRLGYEIDKVGNGIEALAALQHQSYDVVLMDVQMPEMDGFEATRRIHEQWSVAQRPYIIAMTAHALAGDAEKCLAAGMDAYVSKPIQLDKLVFALLQSQHAPLVVEIS